MPKQVGSGSGRSVLPISRAEIIHAQKNTKSNMEAARFIGCGYVRYKKYAKIYNLFDQHTNASGFGIAKGFGARASSVPLKDIFANKYPGYSIIRLKHRMIARNLLREECALCGFKEKRITDSRTPLLLTFKDQVKDFTQSNLHLLCYNCIFLTSGAPTVANKGYIMKSFTSPESIPPAWNISPRGADAVDVGEPDDTETPPDAFDDIRGEVLKELGR